MSTEVVGRLAEIWCHPVKSLLGQRLEHAQLAETGVPGDRGFGIVDTASGKVLSAKRIGRLFEARAALVEGVVAIDLPDGTRVQGAGPHVDAALSAWLGRDVCLTAADPSSPRAYDFGADDEGPARSRRAFVDSSPVHIITTASLRAGAVAAGDRAPWDARRFRPNLVVETDGDASDATFVEDAWVPGAVWAGDAELRVTKSTERCVMTTRAQADLPLDRAVLRTLHAVNTSNLGVYATVTTPGRVAVGNPIRVGALNR